MPRYCRASGIDELLKDTILFKLEKLTVGSFFGIYMNVGREYYFQMVSASIEAVIVQFGTTNRHHSEFLNHEVF